MKMATKTYIAGIRELFRMGLRKRKSIKGRKKRKATRKPFKKSVKRSEPSKH